MSVAAFVPVLPGDLVSTASARIHSPRPPVTPTDGIAQAAIDAKSGRARALWCYWKLAGTRWRRSAGVPQGVESGRWPAGREKGRAIDIRRGRAA
jgi:hypothetical protein